MSSLRAGNSHFTLASLDSQSWDLIASYLELDSIASLIKASNKAIRKKLLLIGGFTRLNVQTHYETSLLNVEPFPTALEPRVVPALRDPRFYLMTLSTPFFRNLTSFTFAQIFDESPWYPRLHQLPKTLTHLDWEFIHPPLDFIGNESLTSTTHKSAHSSSSNHFQHARIRDLLPKLERLSLVCSIEHLPFPLALMDHLPQGLVSFRIAYSSKINFFQSLEHLPPHLTQLAVHSMREGEGGAAGKRLFREHQNEPIILSEQHFNVKLPSTITDLRLYPYRFQLSPKVKNFNFSSSSSPEPDYIPSMLSIQRLHLHSVAPEARPYLPASLKHMELFGFPTLSDIHNPSKDISRDITWPLSIDTFTASGTRSFVSDNLFFSDPPANIINLKCARPNSRKGDLLVELPSQLCISMWPNTLRTLDISFQSLKESMLCIIPSHISTITVFDIHLDGSSIPVGTELIISKDEMIKWFLNHFNRFVLYVRSPRPFMTISSSISLPDSIKTIEFSGHGIKPENLPKKLEKILDLPFTLMPSLTLPPSLTWIGISKYDSLSISIRHFFSSLPNLRQIEGGTFLIDSSFFPNGKSGNIRLKSSPPLLIPESLIMEVFKTFPEVKFENPTFLLDHCLSRPLSYIEPSHNTTLMNSSSSSSSYSSSSSSSKDEFQFPLANHSVIAGTFLINSYFAHHGFQKSGLTILDLSRARFLQEGGMYSEEEIIPVLPSSLTQLTLSDFAAQWILFGPPKVKGTGSYRQSIQSDAWYPTTLKKLFISFKSSYSFDPDRIWSPPHHNGGNLLTAPFPSLEYFSIAAPGLTSSHSQYIRWMSPLLNSFDHHHESIIIATHKRVPQKDSASECSIM
jgi:hypothetical protein